MVIKFKLRDLIEWIMILTVIIWAAGGTAFYYTPVLWRMIIVGLFGVITILFILIKPVKIKFSSIWVLMLGVVYIINNEYINRGMQNIYLFAMYIFILMFIIISPYVEDWPKKLINVVFIIYLFYAACTVWFYFDSAAYYNIAVKFFTNSSISMLRAYSRGCMTGFTGHYSVNGTLVGMATIIAGCRLCNFKKNKAKTLFLFALCFIALLLVGKRAHTIFILVAMLAVYYVYMSNQPRKRIIKMTVLIISLVLMFVLLFYFVPALSTFILRFMETSEAGDITLGRTVMWKIAWNQFISNPWFGIGWGRIRNFNIIDSGTHNIYIQLLAETGVVGTLIYVGWFIYMLYVTVKRILMIRRNKIVARINEEYHLYISLAVQVFFVLYGFTGNPLTDQVAYTPYFLSQGVVLYYKYKEGEVVTRYKKCVK